MTGNSIVADTNIFIDLMKGDISIAKKLESFNEVYFSPVVLAELYFGAYRSVNPEKHLSKIAIAIQKTKLLIIDAATAEMFVAMKLALFAKGKPIPENDIWIAATALQHQLPLYTNDNHFADVEGITLA
ncbi:MAG TPA: type II toxin-antitoxin system VapC family toxin [Chitinophagaceae bacterium]|nr:type II toxin-antitoxin system VapC family toxin [Chitinophagaceae bacterium]